MTLLEAMKKVKVPKRDMLGTLWKMTYKYSMNFLEFQKHMEDKDYTGDWGLDRNESLLKEFKNLSEWAIENAEMSDKYVIDTVEAGADLFETIKTVEDAVHDAIKQATEDYLKIEEE